MDLARWSACIKAAVAVAYDSLPLSCPSETRESAVWERETERRVFASV